MLALIGATGVLTYALNPAAASSLGVGGGVHGRRAG